jgi:protein SCO1/2
MITLKVKLLIGLALVIQLIIITLWLAKPSENKVLPPPLISGSMLLQPVVLPVFSLLDHNNDRFQQANMKGSWHVLAYGFTHCPDVCPTALQLLKQLRQRTQQEQYFDDIEILFYTIDPSRDSAIALANYVSNVGGNITGLMPTNANEAVPIEQSLGLKSAITNNLAGNNDNYQVGHGASLYLFDEQARLQAILQPQQDDFGRSSFDAEMLYKDYIAVREHASLR